MSPAAFGCWLNRRRLERLFARRRLALSATRSLRQHLRGCEVCRTLYDQTIKMERLVEGGGHQQASVSELELFMWSERVVAAALLPATTATGISHLRSGIMGLASAAAVVGLLLLVKVAPDPEFVPREVQPQKLAVRAFCQPDAEDASSILSISQDPGPTEVAGCTRGGVLHFAQLSESSGLLYVVGLAPGGELLWFSPREDPFFVAAHSKLSPVDLSIEIDIAWQFDHMNIVFVLAQRDDMAPTIERSLVEHRELDIENLVVVVRRIDFSTLRQERP